MASAQANTRIRKSEHDLKEWLKAHDTKECPLEHIPHLVVKAPVAFYRCGFTRVEVAKIMFESDSCRWIRIGYFFHQDYKEVWAELAVYPAYAKLVQEKQK